MDSRIQLDIEMAVQNRTEDGQDRSVVMCSTDSDKA